MEEKKRGDRGRLLWWARRKKLHSSRMERTKTQEASGVMYIRGDNEYITMNEYIHNNGE